MRFFDWLSTLENIATWLVTTIVGGAIGGVTWLIRRVLTNEKKIAILEAEARARDKRREEDRHDVLDLKEMVHTHHQAVNTRFDALTHLLVERGNPK